MLDLTGENQGRIGPVWKYALVTGSEELKSTVLGLKLALAP